MTIIALIQNGIVVGVQDSAFPNLPLSDQFHAGLNPTDITGVSPQPQVGWSATPVSGAGWTFAPPPAPPAPTPAQQGAAALASFLAAGLAVTSSGTPALNGTYSITSDAQANIASEAQFISTFSEFTRGATTNMPWVQQNGAIVEFPSTTEFMAFAKTVAQTVSAAKIAAAQIAAGQSVSMPSNAVTIP